MKKGIIALLLFFVFFIILYFYLFQNHRDINSEIATFTVTTTTLNEDFKNDSAKANKKYLDQTIIVSGILTFFDLKSKSIIIDNTVYATFITKKFPSVKVGRTISIKGRFLGYDDLLEQFKVDQISIVQQK